MFGVPMMGADICGFLKNTTVPLCARWSALGAFYPFSRNHNDLGYMDQDPVALGPIVVKAAKDSLNLRYQLLPFLYTLFYKAHIYGDTVFRPLFFEFPQDVMTRSIDTQFMWGESLLVIPTLEKNATSVNAYIPAGVWFRYPTFTRYQFSQSTQMKFDSPLTSPPVLLIRGGNIIATQEARLTTTEARKTKFTLIVGLDENQNAKGDLYWDDGESLIEQYTWVRFEAKNVRRELWEIFVNFN
jgi:lysosomal alpha-glucosidase